MRVIGQPQVRRGPLGGPGLRETSVGGYRQYDIQFPPESTPGPPKGHRESSHRELTPGTGPGVHIEYPVTVTQRNDDGAQHERELVRLERLILELSRRLDRLEGKG